jgi:hypothetical protein
MEIDITLAGLDANQKLVNNTPPFEMAVTASVFIRKSDGTRSATEVPGKVEFSFSNTGTAIALHSNTFTDTAGNKLGKRGNASAVYWKADPSFPATSSDGFKTKCVVDTKTTAGSADLGKAKVFFLPSAAGRDNYKIKARVLAPNGTTELASKESVEFTIWRKLVFSNVYTMNGENYIDTATTHPEIGPAFETTGADGAYVLYERGVVQTLNAALTVKYIGLYDSGSATKMAAWPNDFSPVRLETTTNQLNPTAAQLADYAYAGADPALVAKKAVAKTAIEAKAQAWFNKVSADIVSRRNAWLAAAAIVGGNALLAVQYNHPKLSNQGEGATNFYPAGISINLANAGSGLNQPGHPDLATWREVQGFNSGSTSVIFKNYGSAARLQIVCRHEIGHGTKSAFRRDDFGTGDHSGSGLMTPYAASNTFSNADSAKLRGEL